MPTIIPCASLGNPGAGQTVGDVPSGQEVANFPDDDHVDSAQPDEAIPDPEGSTAPSVVEVPANASGSAIAPQDHFVLAATPDETTGGAGPSSDPDDQLKALIDSLIAQGDWAGLLAVSRKELLPFCAALRVDLAERRGDVGEMVRRLQGVTALVDRVEKAIFGSVTAHPLDAAEPVRIGQFVQLESGVLAEVVATHEDGLTVVPLTVSDIVESYSVPPGLEPIPHLPSHMQRYEPITVSRAAIRNVWLQDLPPGLAPLDARALAEAKIPFLGYLDVGSEAYDEKQTSSLARAMATRLSAYEAGTLHPPVFPVALLALRGQTETNVGLQQLCYAAELDRWRVLTCCASPGDIQRFRGMGSRYYYRLVPRVMGTVGEDVVEKGALPVLLLAHPVGDDSPSLMPKEALP